MTKSLVMLAAGAAAVLAFGVARAETITEKSGNSTATVTQEPGTNMKRKVIKTPNGQTIIQHSGNSHVMIQQSGRGSGSNAVISQQNSGDDMMDDPFFKDDCKAKGKGSKSKSSDDDDDCDF